MASSLQRATSIFDSPLFSGIFIFTLALCFNYLGLGLSIRIMGPMFISAFYLLLGVHIYAYIEVILYVLKKRLGVFFGLVWVAIGLSIIYNIVFNHLCATLIKPGSPLDLKVKYKI